MGSYRRISPRADPTHRRDNEFDVTEDIFGDEGDDAEGGEEEEEEEEDDDDDDDDDDDVFAVDAVEVLALVLVFA